MPTSGKGSPSSDERREIEELRALIGSSPSRASTLQNSTFMRWSMGEENRKAAEEQRKAREALKADAELRKNEALQRAKELRDAAKQQFERDKQVKKEQEQQRLADAQAQRAKEARWQQQREKNAEAFQQGGRKLVKQTKDRQKRMDAGEAAQDKREREEGTRDRIAILEAYKKEQQRIMEDNRAKVSAVKKMTDPAIIKSSKEWALRTRAGSAEEKRKQVLTLQEKRKGNREGHLDKARRIKGGVAEGRQKAKEVQKALHEKKKLNAGEERANDYLVEQEKLRVLAQKKKDHEEVYKKRYASTTAAQKFETTSAVAKPNLSSLDPTMSGGLMG